MSAESQDLVSLREGEYARALTACPVVLDAKPEREEDIRLRRCRCCGEWKAIGDHQQHTCSECQDL
jgi:hypothetical protein